jgi:hypothetical protein
MKLILSIILLCLSFTAAAGYVAGSKINQCDRADYTSKATCEEVESEVCYQVPEASGECGVYKLAKVYGSTKSKVEKCSGQLQCQATLQALDCAEGQEGLINEGYSEAYCVTVHGQELVFDQQKISERQSEREAHEAAAAQRRSKLEQMKSGALSKGWDQLSGTEKKIIMGLEVTDEELGL